MTSFNILGPLEIRDSIGHVMGLNGDRIRTVLALLLLRSNQTVAIEWLIDSIWGEEPPESARKNLQTYIWHIRHLLDDVGTGKLERRTAGYVLFVPPEELDIQDFEQSVFEGESLLYGGSAELSIKHFRSALSMWRGTPLADVNFANPPEGELSRINERWMTALESSIEANMRCGHWSEVIPQLRRLTLENPYRETLWAQLMVALSQCGRRIEALQTYGRIRSLLQQEFGLDPGPALQQVQDDILRMKI